MLRAMLEGMRPHQWVKNLLVLAPLAFAHKFGETDLVLTSVMAFVVFCMLSSSIYLLNDVADRHADAAHPVKKNRPVPAGRLPVRAAIGAFAVLAVGALLWASRLGPAGLGWPFVAWPASYFVLNLAYSFKLKQIVLVDCLCVALGFQIRVHAGAVAIDVETSSWILLCTFFFALFLAFCKRREEVERLGNSGGATRATIEEYDLPFLDQLIAPLAALTILCYALYTVDPKSILLHGESLKFTVPLVVFGVFRYLFLVHKRGEGADPARLLFRDHQLVLSGVLWGFAVWWVLANKG
jgi:4-hydroxybenzoate polyprenyltransferase